MRFTIPLMAVGLAAMACPAASRAADSASPPTSARLAPQAYLAAINSNNLDAFVGMLTDDVVFMAPNDKPYVGKSAVRPWGAEYLKAYKIHWAKPVQEFVVTGRWAFERYSYTETDTPVGGGKPVIGTGWGFVVFHHDADGKWRVARDAWGSDRPSHGP